MELELYNTRVKYENGVLWRWIKYVGWREVKQTPRKKSGYCEISLNRKMRLYHRVVYKVCNPEWDITDCSRDNQIDHICGKKPLDNRIENLRILNHQQNQWNNLHWAKGYTFDKRRNKYQVRICSGRKQTHIGNYDTAEEARTAYLNAKAIHHNI